MLDVPSPIQFDELLAIGSSFDQSKTFNLDKFMRLIKDAFDDRDRFLEAQQERIENLEEWIYNEARPK